MATINSLKKRIVALEEQFGKKAMKFGCVEVEKFPDEEALEAELALMDSEGYTNIVIIEMLSLEEEFEKERLSGAASRQEADDEQYVPGEITRSFM